MKKLKLFLLTLLLAASVLSLTGCKKDAPEEAQQTQETQQSQQSQQTQRDTDDEPVEVKPLKPLDESCLLPEVSIF